jgi:hypothetical protein
MGTSENIFVARRSPKDYFERYPKDHFQTEWRHPQLANIEFTEAAAGVAMKLAAGAGASHV